MSEWDYVLKLTDKELHNVTIVHDNADYDGENCCIIFTIILDEKFGQGVQFYGDTKLECLEKAYKAYCDYIGNDRNEHYL